MIAAEGAMREFDAIVIGGGLVGAAIAYGLVRAGLKLALIDEGDVAFRASRGNFGLVWVQSKGLGAPHYQRWTRASADAWPALAAELLARTGIAVGHERPGGLHLCLGDEELAARAAMMQRLQAESGNFGFEYEMLDRAAVAELLPGIGPAVSGASFTRYDGHVNSLALLHALHKGFVAGGGTYLPNRTVGYAGVAPHEFVIGSGEDRIAAPKIVLAAGLGNAELAPLFGLSAPVRPDSRHRAGRPGAGDADDDGAPDPRRRHHDRRQPGGCRLRHRPAPGGDGGDGAARRAVVSVAGRTAGGARLVGAAGDAAGRGADLRPVRGVSRRLHRQLPQRRHPCRRARPAVRPDGRRRRARPGAGAVLGQAVRCSRRGVTPPPRPSR